MLPCLLLYLQSENFEGISAGACRVTEVENYRGWGWKALEMSNGIITLAIIPAIGGRIMVYDLGNFPYIYVNPAEIGRTYDPADFPKNKMWPNFGGYKTWPAPQERWYADADWPPPPYLDFGAYSYSIIKAFGDTVEVELVGPVERTTAFGANYHGLQFKRNIKLFKGTSRVCIEQTMINCGDSTICWSLWDVTQVRGEVSPTGDDNFWVYFPLNPQSRWGKKGFYVMFGEEDSSQWKGMVAPGVGGVRSLHKGGKIGIDSNGNWIAYVDEKEGFLFGKRFEFIAEAEYPDQGSSLEVFVGADYMEVEVLSPLVRLQPGESYTFREDWYAVRCHGPILGMNRVGAVVDSLSVQVTGNSIRLEGTYGVFYEGTLEVVFLDRSGAISRRYRVREVHPLETLVLNNTLPLSEGVKSLRLEVLDKKGHYVGELDSVQIPSGVR